MTFESTTISSCSFFPLESEVKYLALLPHLRIILVHPELELHSYRRYSAILGLCYSRMKQVSQGGWKQFSFALFGILSALIGPSFTLCSQMLFTRVLSMELKFDIVAVTW